MLFGCWLLFWITFRCVCVCVCSLVFFSLYFFFPNDVFLALFKTSSTATLAYCVCILNRHHCNSLGSRIKLESAGILFFFFFAMLCLWFLFPQFLAWSSDFCTSLKICAKQFALVCKRSNMKKNHARGSTYAFRIFSGVRFVFIAFLMFDFNHFLRALFISISPPILPDLTWSLCMSRIFLALDKQTNDIVRYDNDVRNSFFFLWLACYVFVFDK